MLAVHQRDNTLSNPVEHQEQTQAHLQGFEEHLPVLPQC